MNLWVHLAVKSAVDGMEGSHLKGTERGVFWERCRYRWWELYRQQEREETWGCLTRALVEVR